MPFGIRAFSWSRVSFHTYHLEKTDIRRPLYAVSNISLSFALDFPVAAAAQEAGFSREGLTILPFEVLDHNLLQSGVVPRFTLLNILIVHRQQWL